jgi:hypothetical protein
MASLLTIEAFSMWNLWADLRSRPQAQTARPEGQSRPQLGKRIRSVTPGPCLINAKSL